MSRVVNIKSSNDFTKVISDNNTNAAIIMFNMSGFPPTVESEKKFKEWSISMKNINFGLVDINNPANQTYKDISGREVESQGIPDFIVFKNGKQVEHLMEDDPSKAKKLFDKYNIDQNSKPKTVQMQNDQNRVNNTADNFNTSKDTGRSNVIHSKNSNKPALVMEDALSKAKQQHQQRFQSQSFVMNNDHNKKFYERNPVLKHEMSKCVFIETADQFSEALHEPYTNATIILFNMGGFEPTMESERKFKEWSNTIKNIHFGIVDVQHVGALKFNDSKGKEVNPAGVPDYIVFQNGVRVENLVSENYHKAKALIDKYNVDKKQISKVIVINNQEQFQKTINDKTVNATVLMCKRKTQEHSIKMMEKKFNHWSLTTKHLNFCKLDADRMGSGDYKDAYGETINVEDVPCFIVFQKGLVVKSLVEHDKFDKVKRLIDKYDHLEDKKKPQFMFK